MKLRRESIPGEPQVSGLVIAIIGGPDDQAEPGAGLGPGGRGAKRHRGDTENDRKICNACHLTTPYNDANGAT